jgi:hypothetical protein
MPECRPQDLGEREDEMPVGDGADHLLPDELRPEGGSLGRTGGAKTSLLAGKWRTSVVGFTVRLAPFC